MLEFIRLLRIRYKSVLNHIAGEGSQTARYKNSAYSLTLAEAFLKKSKLIRESSEHPVQVVILGPTQGGKSTIANLLVEKEIAEVSPLAGFTVRPQGICLGVQDTKLTWLTDFYPNYRRYSIKSKPLEQLDSYTLGQATETELNPLSPCVIWDTPDFDSIDAEGYRDSVLRTAALADVIILVVSKDKYADQSVWDLMTWLEPLGQPTVVCVNKISDQARLVIIDSLLDKWHLVRNDSPFAVHSLSYSDADDSTGTLNQEIKPILEKIKKAIGKINRKRHHRNVGQLLNIHWKHWIEPLVVEHHALAEWNALVDQCIDNSMSIYQRDYLDHPQHKETFQRALVELLSLLEIPGLASALVHTRNIVTWPLRQVVKLGKAVTKSKSKPAAPSREILILNQIAEHFLIRLSEAVLEKVEEGPELEKWWRQIGVQLRADKLDLTRRFQISTEQYYTGFLPEIETAAHHLFNKLKTQPAVLNSLRATRITADAAAVALAVKTGGIGMHDFVLTPAVLSITSLLTESALGGYMNKIASDLKQRQYDTVKSQLFEQLLREQLYRLPEKLENSDKFNISKQTLLAAEAKLKDKQYGLQFF